MTAPPRSGGAAKVAVADIQTYPERIDVRSPSEFAEDHLPGAVNLPVLDDDERALVGTLHAQESEFAAKQVGAAIVARNIARIVDTHCRGKPRDWTPLIYCWRGGKRSGALAHVLNEIGWRAVQLDGGYRSYRRQVVTTLPSLPARFHYVVICGLTGSGKSRLLASLAEIGAQVLDLEGLARHRGSLLGDLPDAPQPSQKWFDTELVAALGRLDPSKPVYVESESRKIGTIQVPLALLDAMRGARLVRLDTPLSMRVALLQEEYAHFVASPSELATKLEHLVPLHGRAVIAHWNATAERGDFDGLVATLLQKHYDPTYARALERNFPRIAEAVTLAPAAIDPVAFTNLAREVAFQIAHEIDTRAIADGTITA